MEERDEGDEPERKELKCFIFSEPKTYSRETLREGETGMEDELTSSLSRVDHETILKFFRIW